MKPHKSFSFFRTVIGGKEYDPGNHVWVINRRIMIEFDSDYILTRHFSAKNWLKLALRVVSKIPDPVTVDWLAANGFEVPEDLRRAISKWSSY